MTSPATVRRALPLVALLVVAVGGLLLGGPGTAEQPLDPRGTGPLGAKAVLDVLRGLGAEVDVAAGPPAEGTTAALVLRDTLDDGDRERLLAWVGRGGVLVVAHPGSPLAPDVVGGTQLVAVDPPLSRRCDLPALAGVRRVLAPGGSVYGLGGAGGTGEPGAAGDEPVVGCFPRNGGSWLVARREGDGAVVALGGPQPLLNGWLGEADNAALAVALLAPSAGARVHVLRPPAPGEGTREVPALLPWSARVALWQLVLAFAVLVAWRARRLGPPVVEAQPVAVPASELVLARGRLLHQAGARRRAAEVLAERTRRGLARRCGLPPTTPADVVASVAAARLGADEDELRRLLAAPPPGDDAGLVRHAAALLRQRAARRPLASDEGAPQ